jgi:hypothetical protein
MTPPRDQDSFEDRAERKARAAGEAALDHPWRSFFKVVGVIVAIVVVIGAVGGVVGWVAGWWNGAAEVTGFQNTKYQQTVIIGDYEGLKAAAVNACAAENADETGKQGPTFLEDPAFAYKAKYQEIAARYNRRMNNWFEGKLVGPGGYPQYAPTLSEMQAEVC